MKDYLNMFKLEYLSNHWSVLPQILIFGIQPKSEIAWNEDDL